MISDNWATDMINAVVKFGGTLVSDDQYNQRVSKCNGCEFMGGVSLPGVSDEVKGCTICKCPLATKPRYKKYFSFTQLRTVLAKCPKGFWADIDNGF